MKQYIKPNIEVIETIFNNMIAGSGDSMATNSFQGEGGEDGINSRRGGSWGSLWNTDEE